jgi:hypothetical protein
MKNVLKTNFVPICLAILAIFFIATICLAILAIFFIAMDAQAFDDQKNDMMCMAINQTAVNQYTAEVEAIKAKHPMDEEDLGRGIMLAIHIEHYKNRVILFNWNANQNPTTYNLTVFNNFTKRYMDELDTATALLHLDRCEYRVFEIWELYQALN